MSWRVLFATLLVALGASAWGGIQFGDWLVAHAPAATRTPGQTDANQEPILDADGRPYTAQPPQPRIDGTLGVPDRPTGTNWTVATVSLFDTVKDPSVQISRNNITMDEARQLAAATQSDLPSGPNDVTTLDLATQQAQTQQSAQQYAQIQASRNVSQQPMIQSVDMPAPQQQASAGAGQKGWQDALRRELAQCADAGFFERPTCSWNARNKYCAPNQAWGTIPECPNRP
ncbi:hypothetical protein [Bordetella flabilis]|uniref:Uncharacterized protein n=1 Tax=Bordetella flabilis TaxID=463014 RepID=A0A193G824_9BORD|nr:hypothetical protein [Bordetella flabilis]ANN75813.1 hypothetical protein BAU07_00550 [Bordetella flabilis]